MRNILIGLIIVSLAPLSHGEVIVTGPVDTGQANILTGSDPTVSNGTVIPFDVPGGLSTIFFVFEIQENDASLEVSLDFWLDVNKNNVKDAGEGELVGPDFNDTLNGSKNQVAFEWTLSGVTPGNRLQVGISGLANNGQGPERANFRRTSVVPEPSAVGLMGLLTAGLVMTRRRRAD